MSVENSSMALSDDLTQAVSLGVHIFTNHLWSLMRPADIHHGGAV